MKETQTEEVEMEWWRTAANVAELAAWLDERCELASVGDCIYLFEKPWKWDAEYQAMRAQKASETAQAA